LGKIVVPLSATAELEKTRRRVYLGTYEGPERRALGDIIRKDDIVLEIGAGVGIVSASIASLLEDDANLTVYEANPNLEKSIVAVAEANGFSYRPRIACIGAQDGLVEFFVNDQSFESSSGFLRNSAEQRKINVQQHALSTVLDELHPTVLVIDIEGAEAQVLDTTFPSHVRAMSVEFHPHITGNNVISGIVKGLLDQGFDLLIDSSSERVLVFVRSGTAE